ncbi:calcium-binding protein, partial [Rhodoplanes azumiensis]
ADQLWGGEGDDTFVVDDLGDVVIEYAGQGVDTVRASIDYQIADDVEIENLVLTGTAVTGIGNHLDNHVTGTDAHNVLYGGAGDDTIDGGAGGDHMWGGEGDDTIIVDDIDDVV